MCFVRCLHCRKRHPYRECPRCHFSHPNPNRIFFDFPPISQRLSLVDSVPIGGRVTVSKLVDVSARKISKRSDLRGALNQVNLRQVNLRIVGKASKMLALNDARFKVVTAKNVAISTTSIAPKLDRIPHFVTRHCRHSPAAMPTPTVPAASIPPTPAAANRYRTILL